MNDLPVFFFSGTGNTRYVAERLAAKLSCVYRPELIDIASAADVTAKIRGAKVLLIAFPIYGSAPPIPVRDFVFRYRAALRGKDVILAETQYFFSGDGAASLGRTIERYGGKVIGAEHFNMPNNLSDCKVFPIAESDGVRATLARAEKRINTFTERLLTGKTRRRGFRLLPHALGFCSQRVFWRRKEAGLRKRLRVDTERCVGCGACAKACPAENFSFADGKPVPRNRCVLCYRCVNLCPRRAISLIGKTPPERQYRGPKP